MMVSVSTFAELQTAISNQEDVITVTDSFDLETTLSINYTVEISGENTSIILTRLTEFTGYLFNVATNGNLLLQGLTIDGNKQNTVASSIVFCTGTGIVTLNDSSLQNSSVPRGGAFYLTGSAICNVNNSTIYNCDASEFGGGIYIASSAHANITDSMLVQNVCASFGGAIFVNQGSATINGSVISNNIATVGGGIYFNTGTSFTIADTDIIGNQSTEPTDTRGAGGVLINPDVIGSFMRGSIANNTALKNGGGLYINQRSQIAFNDVLLTGNSTSSNGGAFFANINSVINIVNCEVADNIASNGAGLFINSNATITLSLCRIFSNQANLNGGGVYFNNETSTIFDQCTIFENIAANGGGVFVNLNAGLQIMESIIRNNRVTESGGGVFVNDITEVVLTNIQVTDNYAGETGGGIFTNTNSQTRITESLVERNEAALVGGGIFNTGEISFVGSNSVGDIGVNMAETAPGIYNGGILLMQDQLGDANGLYIVGRSNVAYITAPLIQGTVVQLDLTNYVTPNDAGTPIVVAESTATYPILVQSDADKFFKPTTEFEDWVIRLSDDNTQVLLVRLPNDTITYQNIFRTVSPNPQTYTASELPIILNPPGPVRGYRFVNWYNTAGQVVTVIPAGTTGDLILYARWAPASDMLSSTSDVRLKQHHSSAKINNR